MKLSVSAYRAHASAHKKILSSGYHSQLNYGSTGAGAAAASAAAAAAVGTNTAIASSTSSFGGLYETQQQQQQQQAQFGIADDTEMMLTKKMPKNTDHSNTDTIIISPTGTNSSTQDGTFNSQRHHLDDYDDNSQSVSSHTKSPSQRKSYNDDRNSIADSDWTKSNQRWMKLRTTVQISSAIQKKPPLKREDSFLKRFSTRQVSETQETIEDTGSEGASGDAEKSSNRRRRYLQRRKSVVNPDENFYFYWLMLLTFCVLYNLWTLIVRQSFPELQNAVPTFWCLCDVLTDAVFVVDIIVQLRTGYLEQGLMVYNDKKLACHYVHSRDFIFDIMALIPFDLLQLKMGTQPLLRFTRFFKAYRTIRFYYIVESRTVWPNLWRVVNLIHILLILAHWFGCFYYLLSEAENFQGDWVYPYRPGDYATLTRKYLGSLYWSTLTLTTIGDLPTPETNAEYIFTIVSYLIGVFIFATIVGQVGNVITNRNANRLEFERLLDGAKTYMRHHKVPGGMKRRVLRWYDYSWSRGRIQGGGDINTALGLLPDKLKTELALHVNLSVLKKVTIFQECQPEFLHDLVLKMKAYIFTPGDSICRKGEVAREMFIIADGILEVLSETGKVLTTMKAGDFFGEIGILNLDGLNKRTADVRSVGYSELFSLSREDVLAAMKDYPEAQEILQTLGRKRLMEVRCVNKKYSKHTNNDKESNGSHQHSQSTNQSTESRMVEKFKHDVKGLRNALKISRSQRKSLDIQDVQMQNLSPPKDMKSVLKRISRVRSEEKEEKTSELEDKDALQQDKTPSPIGAGLPLLQRLRLLREKQDREERAVKTTPTTLKSPTHTHVTNTLSPQESIREEPERETSELTISQANETANAIIEPTTSKEAMATASVSATVTATTTKSLGKSNWRKLTAPMGSNHNSNNNKSNNNRTDNTAFSIQHKDPTDPPVVSDKLLSSQETRKITKPSKLTVDTTPIVLTTTSTPTTPWSRLKFATLFSSSYTNLPANMESREDMPLKNYSLGNIPQTIAEEGSSSSKDISQISVSFHKPYEIKQSPRQFKDRLAVKRTNSMTRKVKKFYRSVFDLSPEYKGLPFVKRLKILNDRQRLAELEKSVQSRSYSLDSSKTSSDFPVNSSLYRCYSDTSCIYSRLLTRNDSYSTITSTNTSVSECTQLRCSNASMQLDNVTPAYVQLGTELKELIDESENLNLIKPNLEHELNEQVDKLHLAQKPSSILPKKMEQVQDQEAQAFTKKSFLRSNSLKENMGQKTKISGPKNNIYAHGKLLDRSAVGFSTSHISQLQAADNFKTTSTRNNLKCNEVNELNKIPASQEFPEAQEYFNHILYGINSVIKTNMNEMHMRFKSQFSIMANEIKNRDKIIADLQYKLQNLDTRSAPKTFSRRSEQRARYARRVNNGSKDDCSSDSSAELLFLRGDSQDTVLRPLDAHGLTMTPSTSKNGTQTLGGYFSHFGESIVLDIGDSSSTTSTPSSGKSNLRLTRKPFIHGREEEVKDVMNVRHNDWEVRMLAAEMEKQERKRGYSLSESITEFAELECTDTETDDVFSVATRPRASSLDQFNLTHGRGSAPINNKHFNFKRDREKL